MRRDWISCDRCAVTHETGIYYYASGADDDDGMETILFGDGVEVEVCGECLEWFKGQLRVDYFGEGARK